MRHKTALNASALIMEAMTTSQTMVSLYETTRRNIPEDSRFQTRCHENLKSLPVNKRIVGKYVMHGASPYAKETLHITNEVKRGV
jgi:hypothetical protein